MSWLIVGTVPEKNVPLLWNTYTLQGEYLRIDNLQIPVNRGTPALLAAMFLAGQVLGLESVQTVLAGDIGTGEGSRAIYDALASDTDHCPRGVTFHYLMPDIQGHNAVLWNLEKRSPAPLLVADAGFMYAAKMSGFATHYDLFTPDAGEMAFLADEKAPHPFYTRGFLLQEEERVPELIHAAYAQENAARHLLVKGATDSVVTHGSLVAHITQPSTPTMEPIGGTGDTLTGLVSALLASGTPMIQACHCAALANRYLGVLAKPTPATSVVELLPFLPQALEHALRTVPAYDVSAT